MSKMLGKIRKIKKIFGAKGALSKQIPGYSPRAVQVEMAVAVANALEKMQVLIAEAGTGTGKTYAYLIPSLMSGKKVIISTGTKNLQDQLFHRDIPLIRKALGLPFKVAILKGRSNYICQHRLNTYLQIDFIRPELLKELDHINIWSQQSLDGEIEHLPSVKPDASLLPYMTSTTDNCLGQSCEYFSKCFLFKARRQAQEADLIIINHHLFFADHHLKDAGISELLPDTKAIIFDEAHQLPDIATHFLGESLSSRQLTYLSRDIQVEQQIEAPDMPQIKDCAVKLSAATKLVLQAFGSVQRGSWENIVHKPALKIASQHLQTCLEQLQKILEAVSIRGRGLENCSRRTSDLCQRFNRLIKMDHLEDHIHWYEVQANSFAIYNTPMHVGHYFLKLIEESQKTWIFTSATLSVAGDFSHFEYNIGFPKATRLHLNSPFDYANQALLYLPALNCQPSDESYLSEIVDYAIPLLKLTEGRAFFLFTSHRALREAAILLDKKLEYPLLIQGDAPKSQLLASFCSMDNAILLGTSSFWEGVDVKGSRLSCVIIDKIPFLVPDEPILKARVDYYRKQNKNPFIEYQLPHAVITLRQGAGRLIRDLKDCGVLMLCDPRLMSKEYGKIVMASLPTMPITHHLGDVADFMESIKR